MTPSTNPKQSTLPIASTTSIMPVLNRLRYSWCSCLWIAFVEPLPGESRRRSLERKSSLCDDQSI